MPKGAYPPGRYGSLNLPSFGTCWNFESKTSIVPAWKLVANRNAPLPLNPMARPLYTAPIAERFTTITALAGSTSILHPAIVPSSVANSSAPGALLPFAEMTKPVVALVTTRVGAHAPEPNGAGIAILLGP